MKRRRGENKEKEKRREKEEGDKEERRRTKKRRNIKKLLPNIITGHFSVMKTVKLAEGEWRLTGHV